TATSLVRSVEPVSTITMSSTRPAQGLRQPAKFASSIFTIMQRDTLGLVPSRSFNINWLTQAAAWCWAARDVSLLPAGGTTASATQEESNTAARTLPQTECARCLSYSELTLLQSGVISVRLPPQSPNLNANSRKVLPESEIRVSRSHDLLRR